MTASYFAALMIESARVNDLIGFKHAREGFLAATERV